jgi:hypothetical protein
LVLAGKHYGDGLDIRRLLVGRFGETPERLRDVSVSLDRVGDVAERQGDLVLAGKHYGDGLDIARLLVERFGETPERLRDVSLSLDRVGDVAERQGDLVLAGKSLKEGFAVLDRVPEEMRIPFDAEVRESLQRLEGKIEAAKAILNEEAPSVPTE